MMKKIYVLAIMIIALSSCGSQSVSIDTSSNDSQTQEILETLKVASSILPISAVANSIGGDYVEVENIVPAGVSPHGFDLSAKQMASISESEIVFMIGLEHIDGFLEKAISEEKQIHLADGMELIEVEGHEHDEHSDEGEHEDEHHDEDEHDEEEHSDEEEHDEHGHDRDPHVWLGKDNIITMAGRIRDELSTALPEQAVYFSENTENFIADVETIYAEFEETTRAKIPSEFIVFHDAYNYLMQSAGIDLNLKVPFSENVLHESGTAHMKELIEEVELHGIKYAFTEPQFSTGNLEKFANQYNLTIGILNPLGTNENAGGYRENLRSNLENLSKIYE